MDNRDIITKLEFNDLQMKKIRQGTDPRFDDSQMWQIRQGLVAGVDVSQYADPKFDYSQMDEIRIRLVLIEEIKAQEREIEW